MRIALDAGEGGGVYIIYPYPGIPDPAIINMGGREGLVLEAIHVFSRAIFL